MQSINEALSGRWPMVRRAPTRTLIMKPKLVLLPLILASLTLSSCLSAGLEFRDSFSGRVTTGERIRNGVIDVVTLPIQVPVIAAIAIADAAD